MLQLMTEYHISANEVQEIVDLSNPMNSDYGAEFDNETLIKPITLSNALHCLDSVDYMQQDINDAVFSSLHKVEKSEARNQKDFPSIHQLVS
ncbi:hypothetical protein TNCV_1035591 [Trichonephila clavipes]|nr:hypothetical protein TNCV_1035591 [Trichonephila clavipes]